MRQIYTQTVIRVVLAAVLLGVSTSANGQVATGGQFELSQTVVSSGGGHSNGDGLTVAASIGQPSAGISTGGAFTLRSGFLQAGFLAPTSAGVVLSGRVEDADGRSIRNAIVVATDQFGAIRRSRSNTFGNYTIDGLQPGNSYVITVESRIHTFTPISITLFDSMSGFDLKAHGVK